MKTIVELPAIHISYGNDKEGLTKRAIETIHENCNNVLPYINIVYDRSRLKLGDDVSVFMNELASNTRIIIIMNYKYFTSPYGMEELMKIVDNINKEGDSLVSRVFPLFIDLNSDIIRSKSAIMPIKEYWEKERIKHLDDNEKINIDNIISMVNDIPTTLGRLYTLYVQTIEAEGYIDLLWAINKKLGEHGYVEPYNDEEDMKKYIEIR